VKVVTYILPSSEYLVIVISKL